MPLIEHGVCVNCDKPVRFTDATWQADDELSRPYPPPDSPSTEACIRYKDRYCAARLIASDSDYCFNPPHDWRAEALHRRAVDATRRES